MNPEDLQALIAQAQAQGAGGDAGAPQLPAGVQSLIGGDPAADQGPTISQGGAPGGGSDLVGQAIDILNEAAIQEADEADKQTILTCIANLQKVLANNQSDQDSLLQGKASPRALRRATA